MYLFDDRLDVTFVDPVIIIETAMALGPLAFEHPLPAAPPATA